jgi:hypothetical protein
MAGSMRRNIEEFLKYQEPKEPEKPKPPERKSGRIATQPISAATSSSSAPKVSKSTYTRPVLTGFGTKFSMEWQASNANTDGDKVLEVKNGKIKVLYSSKQVSSVQFFSGGMLASATMTLDEICGIADVIDNLYVGPGYRQRLFSDLTGNINALEPRFEQLYDVKNVSMPVKLGNVWGTEFCRCLPCYYCGLALPIGLIEIDHWYEQTDGRIGAVIKVLRATGKKLTAKDADGERAKHWLKQGPLQAIPTRNQGTKIADGRRNHLRHNAQKLTKQSFSDMGILFLSVAIEAFNAKNASEDFSRHFVDSLVNFAPACGICNKKKNDRLYERRK